MALSEITLGLLSCLLFVFYLLYRFAHAPYQRLKKCGIKGPTPTLFFGNYRERVKMNLIWHDEYLAKTYGPVSGFYVGQQPHILVTDLDMIKQIMVTDVENFPDHPLDSKSELMANSEFPVAIVGMAVRLPGAESCEEFWKLLMNGKSTVSEFPQDRISDVSHLITAFKDHIKDECRPFLSGSFFKSIDKFDAKLFQIDPREALSVEPEQRIFLKVVWELFEDAGYASSIRGSNTGVYVANAVSKYNYVLADSYSRPSFYYAGNQCSCISSRVSRTHDLEGPTVMVDAGTYHSSSLLAIHLACQGLLSGDCEMAVAGGIMLDLLPLSITATQPQSNTCTATENDISIGEGCAAVLLKPLRNALAAGDYIYGTLEVTTLCHSNTAPGNPEGLATMICRAWKLAGISSESLEYIESNYNLRGPIEASEITSAFKMFGVSFSGDSESKIPIGLAKANVGDFTAAGVLALIKILMCFMKNKIPPTATNFKQTPCSNWQTAPVYVNTSQLHWKSHSDKSPRFAGVNSIDLLDGTSFHAVVKEHIPHVNQVPKSLPTNTHDNQLLALAANTEQSLVNFAGKMLQYFELSEDKSYMHLINVCYTINTGREHSQFKHRAIVYATSWEQMTILLQNLCHSLIGTVDSTQNSFGFATRATFEDAKCSHDLDVYLTSIVSSFLNEKNIKWEGLYSDACKVPLLPTYAFDEVRYWPTDSGSSRNDVCSLSKEPQQASKVCTKAVPSTAQRRMIVAQQVASTSTAYVETIACKLKGSCSVESIFKSLVDRHHIMTSRIEVEGDTQAFMITSDAEVVYDPTVEVLNEHTVARDYLAKSISVMNVISAPLVQFRHLQAGHSTILAIHIHCVIVDEVTLRNMSHDLQNLMSGAQEPTMKQPDLSYPDFVETESRYLESSQYDEDDAFWKEMFASLPPDVSLSILPPAESAWNDTHAYEAKHRTLNIPMHAMENISKYCATVGVTVFQYSLACSLLLLRKYLGEDDITLTVPVTTRTDVFLHSDGLFVNAILFRTLIDQNLTVREHIQAVANSWNTVSGHSQYPLDHMIKRLWMDYGKSYTSFCSVMFDYSMSTITDNELRVLSKHAKCPLVLTILDDQQRKSCALHVEWAAEILDAGIVNRLSEGIVSMLANALKECEEKIKDIDVLPQAEHKLLKSFNNKLHHNESHIVYKSFEDNVTRYPHLSAIVCGDNSLTYIQLNEMAERIAFELHQNTDKNNLNNNPVVILMEKSELAVVSILGIWKAGGHFLPIALSSRIILRDVLKQHTLAAVLIDEEAGDVCAVVDGSCPTLNVKHLLTYPAPCVHTLEKATITKESLAYIIRTSGSTGKPKLCKISHTSLATIAHAWKSTYKMDEFCVNVLQWTPLSFDVFIADIIRALMCVPGQLTMCPERLQLDVSYIVNLIKTYKITIADVTPQFGMQIVHNAGPGDLDSLEIFILGSDVLQSHLFNAVKSKLKPDQRVMNCYGMTETTIDSSCFEGNNVPPTRTGTVPIGKPLPGVNFHVLDTKALQPCPVGTVGELYISGNVLASGDVNIVELKYPKCSALKTGDAACWLPSGDIELVGRLDCLVKLRGFRISTTEIENKIVDVIREVKETCVVPLTSSSGVEFLCAFVVPQNDSDKHLDCNAICNTLKHYLPYYMLPDIVHIIDKIPVTSHGKVDHKLLPSFSVLQETASISKKDKKTSHVHSPIVATLKSLFSKALGMSSTNDIDIDLTFMEQGGHSLILVQFATLIKQETSYSVEIADIFSYPSINMLADYINGMSTDERGKLNDQNSTNESGDQDDIKDIAITGIGMRLPGGIESLAQLWEALNKGDYFFQELSESRKIDVIKCLPSCMANMFRSTSGYQCQGAFLESVDQFDHQFFKIPSGEAKYMLPEQRIFLQVATEALAEGRNINAVKGAKIGVYVGAPEQTGYAKLNHPNEPISVPGLMPGMIATRVAYQWDLKGPTMLIDTACSSSLVAMKQACDSIRSKECEGALVGGVNLKIMLSPSSSGTLGQQDDILFTEFQRDPDAVGASVGEAILCLYLEPLSTALKEQKPVYGIVKSTASNCVGRGNGITAPSATSQRNVIKEALTAAGLKAADISFLLAHGTGTKLGDEIELSALSSVFSSKEMDHTLPVGSTKSVFGHVDSASGILGVFKVLASLMTKQIPPTACFNTPHQEIVDSSLYVPRETIPWDIEQATRRHAGVSSYGMTGTNCHVIIAEQQNNHKSFGPYEEQENAYALLLNGKSLKHIQKQITLYKIYLSQFSQVHGNLLPSLCLTVARRLKALTEMKIGHFQFRIVIMATTIQQVMMAIDLISSVKSTDDLIRLSKAKSNIQVYCPDYAKTEFLSSATQSFLQDATISIKDLFHGHQQNIQKIPGVAIAMYSESRHWLDYNDQLHVTRRDEGLVELLHRKLSETREAVRTLPLQPPEDLMKAEDVFCCAIIVKFFQDTELSEHLKSNKIITFETAFFLSGMIPKYKKFFYIMIRELLRNNLVISTGKDECIDSFQFQCEDVLSTNLESVCTYAVEKYPQWADCFRFPLYCSKYLSGVLQGRMNPLSVLFPEGDLNFMYTFDKLGDPLGDVYCNTYMQVIASYAMNLTGSGKKVRVLEVGGGVGQITRQLLSKLKDSDDIEYWFTDVGKSYVEQAKKLFTDYLHMMKFCTFDVTKNAPMQGVVGSFDVVVTFNVIHATPSIMDAMLNLKSCLGDEGTLFIIECAKNETWATLTWGILDGWWIFQDYHIRPNEPMMEPNVWERVLSDAGFASVFSFPVDECERSYVEKFLFVCSAKSLGTSVNSLEHGWWEKEIQNVGSMKSCDAETETENTSVDVIYDKLKRIWLELLGVEDIQPDDDFKSLGGESLLAMQMVNLVRKRIGHQLEMQDTTEYPTLQALANLIAHHINLMDGRIKTQ